MTDRSNERLGGPKAVLERVRPTIVRRRVFEPGGDAKPAPSVADDDAPPSSVDVARALASLRGDELRRLDAIVEEDEAAHPSEPPPPPPPRKTLAVGESIAVAELARRMDVSAADLTAALVAHGFFALSAKATVPRATVREITRALGWDVDVVEDPTAPSSAKPKKKAGAAKKKPVSRRAK